MFSTYFIVRRRDSNSLGLFPYELFTNLTPRRWRFPHRKSPVKLEGYRGVKPLLLGSNPNVTVVTPISQNKILFSRTIFSNYKFTICHKCCGERRIRTFEPYNMTNTLAGCHFRPLSHFSIKLPIFTD